MSVAVAVNQVILPDPVDTTQQQFIVDCTLTLTGNYPANGDTVNLQNLGIPSNQLPNKVEIYEATPSPGPASWYAFVYLPGTTQANGLMEVFNGTTQFSAGAYGAPPFAITGFALRARIWFSKFV